MRKKLLTTAAALLLIGGLTSCVYDRDSEAVAPASGEGSLIINVNSGELGSRTRATDLSATPADEKKVTTLAYAVFRPSDDAENANAKVEFQYLTGLDKDASTQFSTTTNIKRPDRETNLTLTVQANDVIYVVANVTQKVADLLAAQSTPEDFMKQLATIDQAMLFDDTESYANAGTAIPTGSLPMFGTAKVTQSSAELQSYQATVTIRHMLSKVTLNSISLDVTGAQTFTPTAIFLANVPETFDFGFTVNDGADLDDATKYNFSATPAPAKFYQGLSATLATTPAYDSNATTGTESVETDHRIFRDYLGTGDLTATALSVGNMTHNTPHILYAMPNGDTSHDTRLIIEGEWYDGSSTTSTVYYNLQLHNTEASGAPITGVANMKLYPNRHYIVDVIIKREGADDPYDNIGVSQTAKVIVQTIDWSGASKTTTFGGQGGNPSESE